MSGLSDSIREMEAKGLITLPDLRTRPVLFVASDYGGQHNTSNYESLSFVFANLEECGYWALQLNYRISQELGSPAQKCGVQGASEPVD